HAAYESKRESGTETRLFDLHFRRAWKFALQRFLMRFFERAEPRSREIARDAVDAETVGTVRRDSDFDHRIIETHSRGERLSKRRVRGKLDDARMVIGDSHLARRDKHAAAFDIADLSDLEIEPGAGNMRARSREHAHHARARIGSAAYDLNRRAVAGINHTDLQLVGVRMF